MSSETALEYRGPSHSSPALHFFLFLKVLTEKPGLYQFMTRNSLQTQRIGAALRFDLCNDFLFPCCICSAKKDQEE